MFQGSLINCYIYVSGSGLMLSRAIVYSTEEAKSSSETKDRIHRSHCGASQGNEGMTEAEHYEGTLERPYDDSN